MPRDRDYHQEYLDRQERAIERGYDSYAHERAARQVAYDMGADRDNVERVAAILDNYEPGYMDEGGNWHQGDMSQDDWRELYAELHDIDVDDIDDNDFWDWLQEYYDNQ